MRTADIRGILLENEPMCNHTSFGIGGPADILAYPVDRADLISLLKIIREDNLKYFILGGGTNLLIRDGGFRGVVICVKRLNYIGIEEEDNSISSTSVVLYAQAGATMAKLLSMSIEEGFTGFEFAAGIPGTIGGAISMNAGTALGEISGITDSVTLISPDGQVVIKTGEEMGFGYRSSLLPEGYCVLDVRLMLKRDEKKKVQDRVTELLATRKLQQPLEFPSAGSIFKNPSQDTAGKLIELAGLKGMVVGGAQISEKHANFIIIRDKGRASDVLALIEIVKQKVLEVHGVQLELEIKVLGEDEMNAVNTDRLR